MRSLIALSILTVSLSGCLGLGGDRRTVAEVCRTVDHLDLHPDDNLHRRTMEAIALLNESLRKMCLS